MSNDIYSLAAMSLCFVSTSALEVRERCENLNISNKDRIGLIKAIEFLTQECREKISQVKRDELNRPIDKKTFDDLFFKLNCLASAKDALQTRG